MEESRLDIDRRSLAAALNDLEAAKARVERDARAVTDDMRKDLVEKLLPVLDNLDRTIAAAERNGDSRAMVEGVRLVRGQLEGVLKGYGLERVDATDQDFDPKVHDAIATIPVPSNALHDTVLEQLAPGYRFAGSLLRPAKVVVGTQRQPPYHPHP
jgi:molecular chaperone GrpE